MSTAPKDDAQMLRRRSLWFRQFGRLGAPEDQTVQEALAKDLRVAADGLERPAGPPVKQ